MRSRFIDVLLVNELRVAKRPRLLVFVMAFSLFFIQAGGVIDDWPAEGSFPTALRADGIVHNCNTGLAFIRFDARLRHDPRATDDIEMHIRTTTSPVDGSEQTLRHSAAVSQNTLVNRPLTIPRRE
ncbi:MAG: hypothetical protein M1370_07535 [Bacteroidetes bacterium]|nr:hypothetical protein [Bacteroidota bacterium]MCL5025786.1 hypothetical protein [Chloroflexota bacterium]